MLAAGLVWGKSAVDGRVLEGAAADSGKLQREAQQPGRDENKRTQWAEREAAQFEYQGEEEQGAEHTLMDELREAERRLQAAQLAGDTAALDQLLDDRLIFTFESEASATPSRTTSSCTAHGSRS